MQNVCGPSSKHVRSVCEMFAPSVKRKCSCVSVAKKQNGMDVSVPFTSPTQCAIDHCARSPIALRTAKVSAPLCFKNRWLSASVVWLNIKTRQLQMHQIYCECSVACAHICISRDGMERNG